MACLKLFFYLLVHLSITTARNLRWGKKRQLDYLLKLFSYPFRSANTIEYFSIGLLWWSWLLCTKTGPFATSWFSRKNQYNIFSVYEVRVWKTIWSTYTNLLFMIRNNPDQPITISVSNLGDYVDSTKPIKFIIHGFIDRAQTKWILNMTKELLKSVCHSLVRVQ